MARTSKTRGGEPIAIQRLLRDVLSRRGLTDSTHKIRLVREAFAAVLDPRLAGRARVIALRGNNVTIEADTSGLAYELKAFYGKKLLADLKRREGTEFVAKLQFKAGAVANG